MPRGSRYRYVDFAPRAQPGFRNRIVTLCAARQALWQTHVDPGNRNNVAIRLASAFRLAGYARIRTLELLREWNQRAAIGLPEHEVHAVVGSAYARPFPYAYGCHDEIIRSACPFVGRWNECAHYRESRLRP